MRKLILYAIVVLGLLSSESLMATHNRAGEITYTHIEGFNYQVTVRICVDASSDVDRPYIPILWGDGSPQDSIQRTSGPSEVPNSPGILENYYTTVHNFNGPSSYLMIVEDPNRNANINNLENSVETVFSLTTLLVIPSNPGLGIGNNSVIMFNPPKGDACANFLYQYNPLAYDPDGDSLSYSLVAPTGIGGEALPNYTNPGDWAPNGDPLLNGPMTIDPVTGLLTWDTPSYGGEYNIAIRIFEYRQGVLMGYTTRDMQITVLGLCNNSPPELDDIPDTCVVAGSQLALLLSASDPDNDNIVINAFGESFQLNDSPSFFNQSSSLFTWSTTCGHVRNSPYQVLVQVEDNSPQVELFDFTDFNITVIAPAVENIQATTESNDATITWDQSICDNATAYKIYRRIGSNDFTTDYCETGMPEGEGYELIATIDGFNNNLYFDEDIPFGNDVCYRVVACFLDGAESIVSEESCVRIDLEIPVITKVSIGVTDATSGRDTVEWIPPLEINTTDFPSPYHYVLYHSTDSSYPTEEIYTSPSSNILDEGILTYIHNDINTMDFTHRYRVEFYSNGELIESSYSNESIFISITPSDNQLELQWDVDVEWINNNYLIYRSIEGGDFELIDNTPDHFYLDTDLTNLVEYCYYIVSEGGFDDPIIPFDIINYSQVSCDKPLDNTPPCSPLLSYEGSCEEQNLTLIWNNPNNYCADDATQYNLYYSPNEMDDFVLLETIESVTDTTFSLPPGNSVGCFLITALDGPFISPTGESYQNESMVSDTLCIEGCPTYELPNVITPNGDHINDLFVPFPYLSIKDVDMTIYDRWGLVVFKTTDPDINWDGRVQSSGEIATDGVYYFVVQVNQYTLQGIAPRTITGYLHVLNNKEEKTE